MNAPSAPDLEHFVGDLMHVHRLIAGQQLGAISRVTRSRPAGSGLVEPGVVEIPADPRLAASTTSSSGRTARRHFFGQVLLAEDLVAIPDRAHQEGASAGAVGKAD